MVHERRSEGSDKVMELRVSGKVLHGNLIMFDKETGSEYLQETGKGLDGEHKGHRLVKLKEDQWTPNVRWDVWHEKNPESEVLFCDHCETEHNGHNHDGHDH